MLVSAYQTECHDVPEDRTGSLRSPSVRPCTMHCEFTVLLVIVCLFGLELLELFNGINRGHDKSQKLALRLSCMFVMRDSLFVVTWCDAITSICKSLHCRLALTIVRVASSFSGLRTGCWKKMRTFFTLTRCRQEIWDFAGQYSSWKWLWRAALYGCARDTGMKAVCKDGGQTSSHSRMESKTHWAFCRNKKFCYNANTFLCVTLDWQSSSKSKADFWNENLCVPSSENMEALRVAMQLCPSQLM